MKVEANTGNPAGEFLTLMKVPEHLDTTVAAYRTSMARGPYVTGLHDNGDHSVSKGWRVHSWSLYGNDGGPDDTLAVLRHGDAKHVAVDVVPYA